jgi:hypothetical protein
VANIPGSTYSNLTGFGSSMELLYTMASMTSHHAIPNSVPATVLMAGPFQLLESPEENIICGATQLYIYVS